MRAVLQVRAAVSDGDLRIYARHEARAESERTQSEQAVFARCEQAYIEAFSVWTNDELRQIVATADSSRVFPSRPQTWTRATATPTFHDILDMFAHLVAESLFRSTPP